MTLNSKQKGKRGEYEWRDLIRKVFDVKVERMIMSGAMPGWKGDLDPRTLPPILKEYPAEVKYEAKLRPLDYVRQCQEEFNSPTCWHVAMRVEAGLVPSNFLVMVDGLEWLGLMKELQDLRGKKEGSNGSV